jgi:hypothetical protein
MAQIFDMRRLHQGCGESLQSDLYDLVFISIPRWPTRMWDKHLGTLNPRRDRVEQQKERLWG